MHKDENIGVSPNSGNAPVGGSFIISHYKRNDGLSFIRLTDDGEGLCRTRLRSKAQKFSSKEEAREFMKKHNYRWKKSYEIERL